MKNIDSCETAFNLYNKISETKNHYSINKLLKVCTAHNPYKIFIIWQDIINTNNNINISNISHGLLVKCCSNALKSKNLTLSEIKQCIQILQQILINNSQLKDDIHVYCLYIHANGLCFDINSAVKTFNCLQTQRRINVGCVGSLMSAFINNKQYRNAISLYKKYDKCDNYSFHNDVTNLLLLKSCQHIYDYEFGNKVIQKHIDFMNEKHSSELLNTLIDFYSECNDIDKAECVFYSISKHKLNVVNINAMMTCYLKNNINDKCLNIYQQSKTYAAIGLDDVSHLLCLKACIKNKNIEFGKTIIDLDIDYENKSSKTHSLELLTTVIDFYGEISDIQSAFNVFRFISKHYQISTVCIGSMMKCCIHNGCNEDALSIYQQANENENGLTNDTINMLALKACLNMNNIEGGKDIINSLDISNECGLITYSDELVNTIIDFYGQIEDIENAVNIFNKISHVNKINIVFINTMMNAYCNAKLDLKCIQLFKYYFIDSNVLKGSNECKPDHITFATVLKACIQETALYFGEYLHKYLLENNNGCNYILQSLDVQINLICMYGKSSKLDICQQLFDEIKHVEYEKYCSSIILWNAYLNAFARNGKMDDLMELFNKMRKETELIANDKTYCILLNGCSHSGDIAQAQNIWNNYVIKEENIHKCINVNTAYIDCLSRKGLLNEAYKHLLEYDDNVQCVTNLAWLSLLSGCRKYKEKELGQIVFDQFKQRFGENDKYISSATILLANIYGSCNENGTVEKQHNVTIDLV